MTRRVYVLRDGVLVEKDSAPSRQAGGPMVIADGIDPLWHPATGRTYDSKSEFRRATREAGCIEIGNERQTQTPPKEDPRVLRETIGRSIQQVRSGYRPDVMSVERFERFGD